MKKMLAAALVLAAVATVPASAGHGTGDFVATGTILVGNAGTRAIGGVTEIGSPCMGSIDQDVPDGVFNGVDGVWIQLPAGAAGHEATLTADEPNDVDAWFYTDGCALLTSSTPDAYSMTTTDPEPNGNEEGVIPEGAGWVAIDLYVGAAASFTFTIAGAGS